MMPGSYLKIIKMKKLLLISIPVYFILGCGGLKNNQDFEDLDSWEFAEDGAESWDEKEIFNENEEIVIWQSSADREWVIEHTDLTLSFNWKEHQINGTAILAVRPYFYQQDSLVLDAFGMDIISVGYHVPEDVKIPYMDPIDFTYSDSQHLVLRFPSPVTNNMTQRIKIQYIANPDRVVGEDLNLSNTAVQDDKGAYFINTDYDRPFIPMQFWTQGEPQSNCHWFPTIDQPNQKHTHRIELLVPDSMTTLSNGILQSSTKTDGNMRKDIWLMDQPHSVYLTMLAIGNWVKIEDNWNNISVDYYVEPEYAGHANSVFGNTPEMIEFFSNYTGVDYPWKKYSQVVARDFVSGAMENTTATIHKEQLQDSSYNLEDYIAHELFHQWFGDLVTMDGFANLSMNESFATYSEYLWREYKYGEFNADLWMEKNRQIEPKNSPLIDHHYKHPNDLFDDIRYNRGAQILHLLRNEIGDLGFRNSIKCYLTSNAFKNGSAYDWKKCIEETTGRNMDYFFNSWYFKPGESEISYYINFDSSINEFVLFIESRGIESGGVYNNSIEEFESNENIEPKAFGLEVLWKSKNNNIQKTDIIKLNENETNYKLKLGDRMPEYLIVDPGKRVIGNCIPLEIQSENFFSEEDSIRNAEIKKKQNQLALANINSLNYLYSAKNHPIASSKIGSIVWDGFLAALDDNFIAYSEELDSDSLAYVKSINKTSEAFLTVFENLSKVNDGRVFDMDLNLLAFSFLVDDSTFMSKCKQLHKKFISNGNEEERNTFWSTMLDYNESEKLFSNFINFTLDSNLITLLNEPKTIEEIDFYNSINWIINVKYSLENELQYSEVLKNIALNNKYSSNYRTQAAIAHSTNLNNRFKNSSEFYLKILPDLIPEYQYKLLKNGLDYFVPAEESIKPHQYELTKDIWESDWCQKSNTNKRLFQYVLQDEYKRLTEMYTSIDEVVSGTDKLYFTLINDIFKSIED